METNIEENFNSKLASTIGKRSFKNVTKKFNVELFYTDSWLKPNIFLVEFVFFLNDFQGIEGNSNKQYLNWIENVDYYNLMDLLGDEEGPEMSVRPRYWCDDSKKFLDIKDDRLWELIMDEILDHTHEQMNLDEHEKDSEVKWMDVVEHPTTIELQDVIEVDTRTLF